MPDGGAWPASSSGSRTAHLGGDCGGSAETPFSDARDAPAHEPTRTSPNLRGRWLRGLIECCELSAG